MRGRCPACGEGRVVVRFTGLVKSCPACGWILEREPGAITGAMYLTSIVSQFGAVGVMLLCWWLTDWTPLTIVLVGLPVLLLFSWIALAWSKRLWIAVEYVTDLNTDEGKDRYEERGFTRDA